jgi:flagellar hook-basal body complex protein FliE
MSISGISSGLPAFISSATQTSHQKNVAKGAEEGGFSDKMGGAIKDLAEAQSKAAESAKAFEMGKETDLASVMVDQQVASLGFQMALNVRNKALGAYRDIMNMPV